MRTRLLGYLAALSVLVPAEARAQTIVDWRASSGSTPDGSCPWTLTDTSPQDPALGWGVLTVSTGSRSELMHYAQSASEIAPPPTWVIRANLRVVSENHDPGPRRGVGIGYTAATNLGNVLCFGVDEVFLWSAFGVQGATSNVDTDGAFHDYRIEADFPGGAIRVYQDGVQILTGSLISDPLFGAAQIDFGDPSGNGAGVSQWRSFQHNGSVCGCATGGTVLWSAADGGNDHLYETVSAPGGISWFDARVEALYRGAMLATPTTAAEDAFIFGMTCSRPALFRLDGGGNGEGPWMGGYQPPGSLEPGDGWTWLTGEPWSYTNWEAGEPNDCCSLDPGEENTFVYLKFGGLIGSKWGDTQFVTQNGYVLEMERLVGPGVPSAPCISTATPCVQIPMEIVRSDAANVRAFSVTFKLSPSLQLCSGLSSITEGPYLSSAGLTHFEVIDHGGGGLYTVDCAILGLPCGALGSGTLFNIAVKSSGADGIGTVSIVDLQLRDCNNGALNSGLGLPASIPIDTSLPSAVTIAASQKKTGNSPSPAGTTDVELTWTAPEAGATVAIYRKGFGGYPDYDDAGGAAPAAPATPAAALLAGWTLSNVTASGGFDRVAARDFYYYVAFVTDGCGNVSAVSNRTGGTLNYHLGDVHDGLSNCAGNDLVNTSDISFLGANYGITVPVSGALECLDVGPTTDFSVDARPTTDHRLNFEDLILFAINHGQVSAPMDRSAPMAAPANQLRVRVPGLPRVGETFAVALEMSGAGDVQGLTCELSYDAQVIEFAGVEAGRLLSSQMSPGVALSSGDGTIDVALLGVSSGIRGEGEIARVQFRVKAPGDPAIAIAALDARDAANHPLSMGRPLPSAATPRASALAAAMPTPFRESTTLEYALAKGGFVELSIYGVDGRRVATLERGDRAAGVYRVTWNGRDDRRGNAPAGMYYARLSTVEGKFVRTLIRLH